MAGIFDIDGAAMTNELAVGVLADRGDLTTDRLRAVLPGDCTRFRRKIPGQAGNDGGVIALNDGWEIVWNDGGDSLE